MAEKPPAFTVTDRRKFTSEGELREGTSTATAEPSPAPPAAASAPVDQPAAAPAAKVVTMPFRPGIEPEVEEELPADDVDGDGPQTEDEVAEDAEDIEGVTGAPAPSIEQREAAQSAYERTARELERAMVQANPGIQAQGKIGFAQIVQSFYLSAYVALGGATEPGQQARVDILGARDAIDMLSVLEEKTAGNISPEETKLLTTALFELRMMFLEITNALAAQAHRIHTPPPGGGVGGRK